MIVDPIVYRHMTVVTPIDTTLLVSPSVDKQVYMLDVWIKSAA